MLNITLDRRPGSQVGKQLEDKIIRLIRSEALQHDQQLPTVRELAEQLHINRNTVQRVYRNLNQRGLLETRVGDGTYVATRSDSTTSKLRRTVRTNARKLIEYALDGGLGGEDISSLLEDELSTIIKARNEREIGKIESKHRFAGWARYGQANLKD